MDQVTPALIKGTHHCRMRKNTMETMSKRNYVHMCDAPEGGVWFKMEFEGMMEVRSIEEGVERVMAVAFKGSLAEAVGRDGDINR